MNLKIRYFEKETFKFRDGSMVSQKNISPQRRKIFVLLKWMLSILLVIFGIEGILRLTGSFATYQEKIGHPYLSPYADSGHPNHYYRYTPKQERNSGTKEFSYQRTVNELGFVETEVTFTDTALRVLALGDSFTEGVGASFDESWPKQLENLFKAKGADCFVYNAGIGGSDPFYAYQDAKLLLPKISPQLVIIALNNSDLNDISFRGGWKRFKENGTTEYLSKAPWWEPLYMRSHFFRGVTRMCGYNFLLMHQNRSETFGNATPVAFDAIDSLIVLCKQNNAGVIPVFIDTRNKSEDLKFAEALKEKYHQALVIICTDESLLWPIDGHCNPSGYQYVAKQMQPEVEHFLKGENLR